MPESRMLFGLSMWIWRGVMTQVEYLQWNNRRGWRWGSSKQAEKGEQLDKVSQRKGFYVRLKKVEE